jgi:hypothetical protein
MKSVQRLDFVAIFVILCISLMIGILLVLGEPNFPQVVAFSWEKKQIGIQDRSFTLNFNRLMNQKTVEQNLDLDPPLPGKISWSGKNMTYTLTENPIYGKEYTLRLQSAQELDTSGQGKKMTPFTSKFRSRDLIFGYIGLTEKSEQKDKETEEKGKLIFYNATQNKTTVLTPPDLWVVDFAIHPQGDKVIISAFDPANGFNQQKLFTVTTGLNFANPKAFNPVGQIRPLLDSKDYENISFKLSSNGQTLIVERQNRQNPSDHSLWVIFDEEEPKPLGILGQDFHLSPDGNTLVVTLNEGISFKPLTDKGENIFYSGYSQFLAFSADGSQKLMEKVNNNYTRSLVLVDREGKEQELGVSLTPFIDCQFEPKEEKIIFCAKTDVMEKDGIYIEKPILAMMDISKLKFVPLISLPNDPNLTMTVSADGLFLVFDQVQSATDNSNTRGINEQGKAIALGKLWLFPLPAVSPEEEPLKAPPQEIGIGYHPQWLP